MKKKEAYKTFYEIEKELKTGVGKSIDEAIEIIKSKVNGRDFFTPDRAYRESEFQERHHLDLYCIDIHWFGGIEATGYYSVNLLRLDKCLESMHFSVRSVGEKLHYYEEQVQQPFHERVLEEVIDDAEGHEYADSSETLISPIEEDGKLTRDSVTTVTFTKGKDKFQVAYNEKKQKFSFYVIDPKTGKSYFLPYTAVQLFANTMVIARRTKEEDETRRLTKEHEEAKRNKYLNQ